MSASQIIGDMLNSLAESQIAIAERHQKALRAAKWLQQNCGIAVCYRPDENRWAVCSQDIFGDTTRFAYESQIIEAADKLDPDWDYDWQADEASGVNAFNRELKAQGIELRSTEGQALLREWQASGKLEAVNE